MKKIKIFKSGFGEKLKLLLIPIGLLIGSINTAWGYEIFSQSGANAYFDNTNSNWNNSVWYFGIGKDKQNVTFWQMHDISNTKLKVVGLDTWNNANFFFVSNPNDTWGGTTYEHMSGNVPQTTGQYRAPVESNYTFTSGHYYLLVPSSGDHETSFSCTHKGSSGSGDIGYFSQTVNVELNGETPSTSPAAISITSYSWSAWDAVSENSVYAITKGGTTKTDTYSAAAYTAKTTLEVTDIASGYSFVGWYKDGYLDDEDEYPNKYIYYPRENNTIIARFENRYDVAVSAGAHGRITSGSASVSAGYYTTPTISAETYGANSDQYRFEKWVCTGGASVANANSATTTVSATSAGTVTAQFVSVWCVKGGEGSQDGVADALGDWDVCNSLDYTGTAYEYEGRFELVGGKTYDFQLWDFPNSKWYRYGKGNGYVLAFIGQTYASLALNVEGTENTENNLRVLTAGTGTYIFKWNSSTKTLKIEYPSVTHPSSDYVYFKDAASWSSNISAHVFTDSNNPKTGWNRIPLMSTCSFAGETYYYAALGGETSCVFTSGTDNPSTKTADLTTASSNKGKYYNNSTNSWNTFDVTVTLNNQSATTAGAASVTATYGSAMPSIAANKPAKTGYDFQGYFASTGGSGTKYYNTNGTSAHVWDQTGASPQIYAYWTPKTTTVSFNQTGGSGGQTSSVTATYDAAMPTPITTPTLDNYDFAGYWDGSEGTGNKYYNANGSSAATWNKEDATYTLHAKWDEKLHTVTLADNGKGHVEIDDDVVTSVSGVGVETVSDEITAVPTPGYKFVNWTGDFGSGVTIASGSTTSATITINATADSKTITANFTEDTYTSENNISRNSGDSDGTYSVTFNDSKIVIEEGNEPVKAGYEVEEYHFTSELNMKIVNQDKSLVSAFSHAEVTYISGGKWVYPGDITIYPKWAPKPYTITLNQQGGSDGSSYFTVTMNNNNYKYGVDEDDEITKPTKTGYTFGGYYTAVDGGGTQIFEINGSGKCVPISGVLDYTAPNGNWINTDDDLVLYAYWTANTYTITLDDREATGSGTDEVTATYDSDDLSSAISNPTKWGNTFAGWVANSNGTGNVIINTSGELVEGISGYTDGEGNWTRDNGNLTLYAKWTPKAASSIYLIDHSASPTAVSSLTTFNETGTAGVYYVTVDMNTNDVYHFGDGVAAAGPAGASADRTFLTPLDIKDLDINSYGFKYTGTKKQTVVFRIDLNSYDDKVRLYVDHLVIYRNGDKGGDGHVAYGSVAGFNGTIYGEFEYRMSVHEDTWSSLYLPFSPSAVKVWDAEDGAYYPVLPYYRTKADGPLYDGHYVIRKPSKNTNLELENFGKWTDPEDDDELPVGNQPYIIQWHDFTGGHYFEGRYISFYGDDGVSIPSSMPEGTVPETGGVVNICGNTALIAGEAEGAYVLNSDYGEGAWLRGEKVTDKSPVGPFECFILADAETTSSHLVIKRRTGDDTTTGWDDVLNTEPQTQVIVYSITGTKVAQYENCSLTEAGLLLNAIYNEGVFILRAGNESVKLIIR